MIEIDPGDGLLRALRGPLGQVANVANGGLHHEASTEILLDRLGLGGALDDHQLVVASSRRGAGLVRGRGFPGHGAAGGVGRRNIGIGADRPGATIAT